MKTISRTLLNLVFVFSALLFTSLAVSEEPVVEKTWNQQVSDSINQAIAPATNAVAGAVFYAIPFGDTGDNDACDKAEEDCFEVKWIVVWLALGAVFFTFYLNFINFRGFKHAWGLVFSKDANPENPGDVTHFQALTTALSGTVGLGNIAGVAVAISVGGPGATFWMILAGIFGMSSKFAECTLGVKYRDFLPDGRVAGGPMRYLEHGLAEKGFAKTGKFLAYFFAFCCVGGAIGGGNMFQANQAYAMVVEASGGEASFFADKAPLFGLILAISVGVVIIGGIRSIARVTAKLVPFMAVIYVSAALFILIINFREIPHAFVMIFSGAFSPEGVVGGAIGALIQGLQRAAFSNEAGIGSASIAHSAAKTKIPVTEGFVALLEPFIDTVVICTMTALVIIITGHSSNPEGLSGVALTSQAFTSVIPWFKMILTLAVVLFAYSTMLSWSYYGVRAWTHIFGHSRSSELTFKLIFCFFILVGSVMSLGNVIDFSDSMIFSMSLANLIGLYILAPVVKSELKDYWARWNAGEIDHSDL